MKSYILKIFYVAFIVVISFQALSCEELQSDLNNTNKGDVKKIITTPIMNKNDLSFINAIKNDDFDRVKNFIDNGYDVNTKIGDANFVASPLFIASLDGKYEIAKLLIKSGAHVNVQVVSVNGKNGWTPLIASADGHENITRLLLESNADINIKDAKGNSVLDYTIYGSRYKVFDVLKDFGVNINQKNKEGSTPLHNAAIMGDVKMAKILLKLGADLEAQNNRKMTPVYDAIINVNNDRGIILYLVESGANLKNQDSSGRTPLHHLIINKKLEYFDLFIKHKADPDEADEMGTTALHALLHYYGAEDVSEYLRISISSGANVDAVDYMNRTPLQYAVINKNIHAVDLLLEHNADVNKQDKYGDTALHYAAKIGNLVLIQRLKNKGGDINLKNKSGISPMDAMLKQKKENRLKP